MSRSITAEEWADFVRLIGVVRDAAGAAEALRSCACSLQNCVRNDVRLTPSQAQEATSLVRDLLVRFESEIGANCPEAHAAIDTLSSNLLSAVVAGTRSPGAA